jgi:hypothetical protein
VLSVGLAATAIRGSRGRACPALSGIPYILYIAATAIRGSRGIPYILYIKLSLLVADSGLVGTSA